MDKFKIIDDLTSDVLFEAYGKDMKELFENSERCEIPLVWAGRS